MIEAIEYPRGYYEFPESPPHCKCPPCEVGKCTGKVKSPDCVHGENDFTCEHQFCTIDNCGELLNGDEEDLCNLHQLIYEMKKSELGR